MKKTIILSVSIIFSGIIIAQPTITQGQFPWALGIIITSYNQPYAATSEGINQTWDYTGLDISSPQLLNTIDPVSSSISGLPTSSFCINSSPEECFLVNSAGLQRTGLGGSGSSVPFQNSEFLFHFPITYGDSTYDNFHSTDNLGGFVGTRDGNVEITVVGYGTLMLPNSVTINNAMLVKTHEQYVDSNDFGTLVVTNFDFTTYNFYASGYPWSILLMASGTATPGGPISLGKYYQTSQINSLQTYNISQEVEIYPNPVEDVLTVNNSSLFTVNHFNYNIVNSQGEIVANGIAKDQMSINVAALTKGIYLLQIIGDKFQVSKRFVKI